MHKMEADDWGALVHKSDREVQPLGLAAMKGGPKPGSPFPKFPTLKEGTKRRGQMGEDV